MSFAALTDELLKVVGIGGLVLLNGFFVAAEFALVRIRGTQLDALIAKGQRRARTARRVLDNLDAYISATQLGITLVGLGVGAVVEPVFRGLLLPVFGWLHIVSAHIQTTVAVLVGFFINSYLLIVVGELAPKALAIRRTLPVMLGVAGPMVWMYRLSYPFIWLLNRSAQSLLRQCGVEPAGGGELAHSEEELRLLISTSPQLTGSSKVERDIVLNALDLRRRIVREVMRPRGEIVTLDTTASIAACLDLAEKTRYSRFPLCVRGDLDQTIGVVHFKDLFAMRLKVRSGADLKAAARRLIYVPETARLDQLLQLFLERKLHFAIVVDEFGGTVGMVTLENILEEVVGQIQDEFDQEKPLLVKADENTWELAGTLPLYELAELVGEPLHEEGIATTSGWVTHRLGGFPKTGDILKLRGHELRVEEIDGRRVARLKLMRLGSAKGQDSPVP